MTLTLQPTCETISKRICQEGHANALALNKDSTQIAVAGRSLLKVYSIETDGFVEACNMRGGKNQNLSYSSNDVAWSTIDHNLLATAATNGVISVWDLSKFGRQKQLYVYNEHERTAHTVTFHGAEPNLLVSGSQDGTIKCFDLRCEKAVNTYCSNAESVRDVKFSPQQPNQFAAVSENGTVQLWDLNRPDRCVLQFTAHSGPIYTCDWHPTQPWLATGSRDRQIKVWRMDQKPTLEYNIHTIAVVGRVKWRPDRQFHIASCALVMDYSIYIWDVRRPYIPYASFNEHTNVTTGIAFKGSDPHVLMSASKDSTIFKHSFQDATRPTTKANPQATSFNLNGDLLFAYKLKYSVGGGVAGLAQSGAVGSSSGSGSDLSCVDGVTGGGIGAGGGLPPTTGSVQLDAASSTSSANAAQQQQQQTSLATSAAPPTPNVAMPTAQRASSSTGASIADTIISSVYGTPRSTTAIGPTPPPPTNVAGLLPHEQFHLAKSALLSYTNGAYRTGGNGGPREYDVFRALAREYILSGAYLPDICDYNADIARKYGKANVSMLWRFVGNQYALASTMRVADAQRKSFGSGSGTGGGGASGASGSFGGGGRFNKQHHHHHHHHHPHLTSKLSACGSGAGTCSGGSGSGGRSGTASHDASAEQELLAQLCCDDVKLQDGRRPKSGDFRHSSSSMSGGIVGPGGGRSSRIESLLPVVPSSSAAAAAASMLVDLSADQSLASFMHGETEELTVHDVKGLRNGFLYIGPHDVTGSWSLPHNNLNELQSKKAAQDMEAERRDQAEEEGTILPEPPRVLKLIPQPTAPLFWQPHEVLADGLQLQTDIGDVQTAVCILTVMGDRRHDLPIDDVQHEAWLLSYIELLHRHQMWTEAAEIINLAWIYSARELNQQSTTMHTNCGDCGRPMSNLAGWLCGRCKSARATCCAVCNRPVRGLYAWCQGCAHGGHLEHMRQWFGDHSKCPKCGHMCEHD